MIMPDFNPWPWAVRLTLAFAAVGVLASAAAVVYGFWRLVIG